MKRVVTFLIIAASLLTITACDGGQYKDVTPSPDAVDTVYMQKTVIEGENKYTYKEKKIDQSDEIVSFLKKLDEIRFEEIEPVEFSKVDFLIVFDGKKKHKMLFLDDEIIYDGRAYKSVKGSLKKTVSKLYDALEGSELDTTSKLFS